VEIADDHTVPLGDDERCVLRAGAPRDAVGECLDRVDLLDDRGGDGRADHLVVHSGERDPPDRRARRCICNRGVSDDERFFAGGHSARSSLRREGL